MLLGIDVGGTYTDAVIIDAGKVICFAKSPTTHQALIQGILGALDGVIRNIPAERILRVALSTTLVTNAIIEQKTPPVGVFVIPGPGVDLTHQYPPHCAVLSGSIDHRGREVAPCSREEVEQALRRFRGAGISTFAVIGKFSVRNPQHELQVARWISELYPEVAYIARGHQLGSGLNFPRRIFSAYFNASAWGIYQSFVNAIEAAMKDRHITAPVFVLKADGGTIPLQASRDVPVETIFTGPAASILGVRALSQGYNAAVSMDIGGTTTDIALWRHGMPIFAPKGVRVAGKLTQVRSYLTHSVGIGGDSWVRFEGDRLRIGPERMGIPAALGGPVPTLTDALRVRDCTTIGDLAQARDALRALRPGEAEQLADEIIEAAARSIVETIDAMVREWEQEPAYRINEIVQQERFVIEQVIGVGGGAGGVVERVAAQLRCDCIKPHGGQVANAIGAAIAKPTLTQTVRVDTEQGRIVFVEQGQQQALNHTECDESKAVLLAETQLNQQALANGIEADEIETAYLETFNVVRGYYTTGKIITAQVQVRPGILSPVAWEAGDSGE